MTTSEQVLKCDTVYPCRSTRLSKSQLLALKKHDRNFLTRFSLSHANYSAKPFSPIVSPTFFPCTSTPKLPKPIGLAS